MNIYNSLTRKKETFKPIKKNQLGIYVCGPTVYDEPHIGHARSAYIFEVIRRYLKYKKYKVKFVRNITDVDDKIINKAKEEFKGEDIDSAVKKIASKYLSAYYKAMDDLGISAKTSSIKEPKASEYIDKMKEFIKILIKKKAAYESGGDVYFDITKAENYGKLSNQSQEAMQSGVRVAPTEHKRNPLDFALWKSAKEGEPSWESPWGCGRPGWHIECSVMSTDILGDEFDIHGGGLDLIFPHHENEIAQAEAAGKKFAKIWMHHGLLTINGQKMAKSLGNFITVEDFLKRYNADVLKLFFLQTHYSQPIDFTWERMEEKREALNTIIIFLERVKQREGGERYAYSPNLKAIPPKELRQRIDEAIEDFEKEMNEDFNTPNAIAILFEIVRICNKVIYAVDLTERHLPALNYAAKIIKKLGEIFTLSFEIGPLPIPKREIEYQLKRREELRREKDYETANQIRKELAEKGIILEDTKEGTIWRRKI